MKRTPHTVWYLQGIGLGMLLVIVLCHQYMATVLLPTVPNHCTCNCTSAVRHTRSPEPVPSTPDPSTPFPSTSVPSTPVPSKPVLTENYRKCIFPFRLNGTRHDRCVPSDVAGKAFRSVAGGTWCPTKIHLSTLEAEEWGECTEQPASQRPCRFSRTAGCEGTGPREMDKDAGCADDIPEGASGYCECSRGNIEVLCTNFVQRCSVICSAVDTDLRPQLTHNLAEAIVSGWTRSTPDSLQSLLSYTPPSLPNDTSTGGTGVVFMAGGVDHLPSAVMWALYIKRTLQSPLPIEIWRVEGEAGPSEAMEEVCRGHGIAHRVLRQKYVLSEESWKSRWKSRKTGSYEVGAQYRLAASKPLVIALSQFDTVVYLDDDVLPAADPAALVALLRDGDSAVFWRDLWEMWSDARIWDVVRRYPANSTSMDSGVMVICKSCGGWAPLLAAGYMNYHHTVFYQAIYEGGFTAKEPPGFAKAALGAGDKDTFQVAWMSRSAQFRMMDPMRFAGPAHCGTAIVHADHKDAIVAFHTITRKARYKDWAAGKLPRLGINFLHTLNHPRPLAGQKEVQYLHEPFTAACLQFKPKYTTVPLPPTYEQSFMAHLKAVYSTPWLVEWVSSHK